MKIKNLLIIIILINFSNYFYGTTNIKKTAIINFPPNNNLKQTYNDCGPYSCFAVLKILKIKNISIKGIIEKMKWRLANKYTLPWGLEKILKSYGLKIKTPNFINYNNEDKIRFIKQELAKGNPIIILGGIGKYQHYVTLLGYNNDTFFVYDSLLKIDKHEDRRLTIDLNNENPGNKAMSKKDLLIFWQLGGKYNLFKWYALVALKDNKK